MSHLMQPIEIAGDFYCLTEQGNARTQAILAGDAVADGANRWRMLQFESDLTEAGVGMGTVTFGVSCATDIAYRITASSAEGATNAVYVAIRINGDVYQEWDDLTPMDYSGIAYISFPNAPSPCGNVIHFEVLIHAEDYPADTWTAHLEILGTE